MFGVSSVQKTDDRETWWWNEDRVQDSIQKKRFTSKEWNNQRVEESRLECKAMQYEAMEEVA